MTVRLTHFSTIRDLLRHAVTRFTQDKLFFGHGSSNAFDEATFLILHTLSLPIDKLDPFMDARLLPAEIQQVLIQIERRTIERLPVAYLTKEAWLQGYSFYVDERVIVPRSFLAELIVEQLNPWVAEPNAVGRILDLCTGSGCLAVLLADAFPNAHIDAVDISTDALSVAQKNVETYELKDRISLIHSDLYLQLPSQKYDLIISNPPYVNSQSMKNLPREYQYEPQLALAGGADGMDLVRKIVAGAKQRLNEKGMLFIEVGNEAKHAEAAFPELNLTWLSTSGGDDRVFMLTRDELRQARKT